MLEVVFVYDEVDLPGLTVEEAMYLDEMFFEANEDLIDVPIGGVQVA